MRDSPRFPPTIPADPVWTSLLFSQQRKEGVGGEIDSEQGDTAASIF